MSILGRHIKICRSVTCLLIGDWASSNRCFRIQPHRRDNPALLIKNDVDFHWSAPSLMIWNNNYREAEWNSTTQLRFVAPDEFADVRK